jgi:hypothetical protein
MLRISFQDAAFAIVTRRVAKIWSDAIILQTISFTPKIKMSPSTANSFIAIVLQRRMFNPRWQRDCRFSAER